MLCKPGDGYRQRVSKKQTASDRERERCFLSFFLSSLRNLPQTKNYTHRHQLGHISRNLAIAPRPRPTSSGMGLAASFPSTTMKPEPDRSGTSRIVIAHENKILHMFLFLCCLLLKIDIFTTRKLPLKMSRCQKFVLV